MIRLGNNEVLKTLTKTLTFVDADANSDAGGSTIALPERCSGELKQTNVPPPSPLPRVVILVHDTMSCAVLHPYQVSSGSL